MCVTFADIYLKIGGTVLPIYVSKEKVLFNSDAYLRDVKDAEQLLKELERRIWLWKS